MLRVKKAECLIRIFIIIPTLTPVVTLKIILGPDFFTSHSFAYKVLNLGKYNLEGED